MADSAERLNYMKKFCGIAVRLESEELFWLQMLAKVNEAIGKNNQSNHELSSHVSSIQEQLRYLGTWNQPGLIALYNKIKQRKKNFPIFLGAVIILPSIDLVLGLLNGSFFEFLPTSIFFYLIGAFILHGIHKKTAQMQRELNSQMGGDATRRKMTLLEEDLSKSQKCLADTKQKTPILNEQKQSIEQALAQANQRRRHFYASSAIEIHKDHQNLKAMKAFFYYLDTKRVTQLEGHGGLYDTYAQDCQREEQLEQLKRIDRHMKQYHEELLGNLNYWGSKITSQLGVIAANTAETAHYARQTAHNTAVSAASSTQSAAYQKDIRDMEAMRNGIIL